MEIEISNLRIDGKLVTHWDALLRVVCDFVIHIDGRRWYEEEEFCVVEFANALFAWRVTAARLRGAFAYSSMESEEKVLIAFTQAGDGSWTVASPHQSYIEERTFSTAELDLLTDEFLARLGRQLPERERVLGLLGRRAGSRNFIERLGSA